ncbi:hypothetical protein ABIB95_009362, partial [Bradyrhizobium sp. LA2.1]
RRCLNGSDAALDTKAIRQKRGRHRAEKIALTVQLRYRAFLPTTSDSAPVSRIGTLVLAESIRLSFSLGIGTTGS